MFNLLSSITLDMDLESFILKINHFRVLDLITYAGVSIINCQIMQIY